LWIYACFQNIVARDTFTTMSSTHTYKFYLDGIELELAKAKKNTRMLLRDTLIFSLIPK